MSKGSRPRPFSVSQAEYDTRWDAIFRRDGLEDSDPVDKPEDTEIVETEIKDSVNGG